MGSDNAASTAEPASNEAASTQDRTIGSIISQTRNLSAEQVERIVVHQREQGIRFGEAAVALGFASTDDVLFALAQQFHYPYASEDRRKVSPELVVLNEPFSRQAESFRAIRSQILMRTFVDSEVSRPALAVVSPDAGDGKTYFAANLAAALAQLGGKTLLVDADLRGPRQHELFQLSNRSGLSGILSGRAESQVVQQVPGVPSLFVLPGGTTPPNPVELVERPAFGLLVRELTAKFDHVIVDTAALAYGSDASIIAARCGAALMIARPHVSRVGALRTILDTMFGPTTRVAGVVINEH